MAPVLRSDLFLAACDKIIEENLIKEKIIKSFCYVTRPSFLNQREGKAGGVPSMK